MIGQCNSIADHSVHGASNKIVSDEGVGTPNIALARARVQAEQVGRLQAFYSRRRIRCDEAAATVGIATRAFRSPV
jgi:hypothetical protein